jgi:hypothetical protein
MNYFHFRSQFLVFLVIALFASISSCAPVPSSDIPTSTNIPISIVATSVPTVIPLSIVEPKCPGLDSNIQFNIPDESGQLEISILQYLNAGGDPANIKPVFQSEKQLIFDVALVDLDGDSLPEFVLSNTVFSESQVMISIYHCAQADYRLAKSFILDDMSFGEIQFSDQLFISQPSFLVLRVPHNRGWAEDYIAVGWHNSEWQTFILGSVFLPSTIILFDQNNDNIKEVFLQTKTSSTPGGGTGRAIIDTYSWNGKEFILLSSELPPGSDRIHYLQDAESAWARGNPLLAVAYYEIAAKDPNLLSYPTTHETVERQTQLAKPYQQSFAFFRIVAIWFYLERPEDAAKSIQEMSDAFPDGKPGSEFVIAAKEFATMYESGLPFHSACLKVASFLDSQYPNVVTNHLGDWGVANPIYSAASDICKFN